MYKILLCLRYLRTRWIAMASIISVMLGVATMIVVNSVMAGFATEMRERIHGILADVVLETHTLDGDPDAAARMREIQDVAGEYIEAMTATVEVYGMVSFKYRGQVITRPVTLIGIDPQTKAAVSPLVTNLSSFTSGRRLGLKFGPESSNCQVIAVTPDSAAAIAGLENGDVITACNGDSVEYTRDLSSQLKNSIHQPTVSLAVRRGKRSLVFKVKIPRPSWDLTADARAHRRTLIELERRRIEWNRPREILPAGGTPLPPPGFDAGPSSAPPTGTAEQLTPPSSLPDAPDLDALDPPTIADGHTTEDPAASLPACVYLGSGLIEFPMEDKETGEIRIERMVLAGEDVRITTVSAGRPPEPRHFTATVIDVFKSGMSEYDSNLVFCNLEELQQRRGMVDPSTGDRAVTSIQIKLKDFKHADTVIKRLRAAFPAHIYSVRTWQQKQGPLLAAVELETGILNILLFLIITVAGFGILAIFYMIVVEKTRDIGILKALGASSRGVMSIFLGYGIALGIVGSGVGVLLGLVFVWYINEIESGITWLLGRKVFDETIYYFPEIPTAVDPFTVAWIALGAVGIAVLASILPARRAAKLHPVEALRHE
ncbi:MAG: FtsX-like permease family protein [Planctomycetaceae bacterium]|jgi:lipoprotein-releasing system permease protein|nr:FtsX-like permease family protein [Planctomycetaceae bacterium]